MSKKLVVKKKKKCLLSHDLDTSSFTVCKSPSEYLVCAFAILSMGMLFTPLGVGGGRGEEGSCVHTDLLPTLFAAWSILITKV